MDSIARLINALRCLPGVGPKSASRMAYHLLKHHRPKGMQLAACLEAAMTNVTQCETCNNFSDESTCNLCKDSNRDTSLLCIVDSPTDLLAIEQTLAYKGRYFVLLGRISPIDGLGPDEIGLPKLQETLMKSHIKEIILAISPTVEGQTTMYFIREMLKSLPIQTTQLAHGIPSGGELEFLDGRTITNALANRASFKDEFA